MVVVVVVVRVAMASSINSINSISISSDRTWKGKIDHVTRYAYLPLILRRDGNKRFSRKGGEGGRLDPTAWNQGFVYLSHK